MKTPETMKTPEATAKATKTPILKKFAALAVTLALSLAAALTLAACGKTVEFKINFMVDGAVYSTINTGGNEAITLPDDPAKDGFIFDGWYWDDGVWKRPFTAYSLLGAPLSANAAVYAKWENAQTLAGTQAAFEGFTQTGETMYTLTVSNATDLLSLNGKVSVHPQNAWVLTTDVQGNQAVASKIAALSLGDNTYYVLVTAPDGEVQLYTLLIYRTQGEPLGENFIVTANGAFGTVTGLTELGKTLNQISIPSVIGNLTITSIGSGAFYECSSLESITIPESVTSIGSSAFSYCDILTSITLPSGVTTIGYKTFAYCRSLTIRARVSDKPAGWDSNWNYSNRPVVWGYARE